VNESIAKKPLTVETATCQPSLTQPQTAQITSRMHTGCIARGRRRPLCIEDAVVKLDGDGRFAAMNKVAAHIYQRLGLIFF
jgi:hypothetical protein